MAAKIIGDTKRFPDGSDTRSTATKADGTYRIDGVPLETTIEIVPPNRGQPRTVFITSGAGLLVVADLQVEPIPSFGCNEGTPRTTIQGTVYDDNGIQVDGATVTATDLGDSKFANGSDTLVTMTRLGTYAINGALSGQPFRIVARKAGYSTSERTIVPVPNMQQDPRINRLDFGSESLASPTALHRQVSLTLL